MNWIKNLVQKATNYAEDTKKQKWFGALLIAVAIAVFYFRGTITIPVVLVTVGLIAFASSKIIKPILFCWMLLGGFLSEIGSTILMTVVYFIIAWPLKLFIKKPVSGWHTSEQDVNLKELY